MSRPRKPLHKDPSFWIVVVTLVGGVNLAQLYFAVPWFQARIAAMRPAPKAEGQPDRMIISSFGEPANLDTNKKTFSWQTPRPQPQLLDSTPPQVVIIPTEYQPPSGGWSMPRGEKAIGIRVTPDVIVLAAYRWTSRNRVAWPGGFGARGFGSASPVQYYDFIANLPTGAMEALQEEVRKKLGLSAERQTIQTNVFILKVHHADAPGLKPGTRPTEPQANQPGMTQYRSLPMTIFANLMESRLGGPVMDQTGLTGNFDIQFPSTALRPAPRGGQPNNDLEQTRQVFREHLGLELEQTNAPVEFLVVKKIN